MIAFGASITDAEAYRRFAEPGIRRGAEPDSAVLAFAPSGSVGRGLNLILEAAAELRDLEALVLVHANTEIAQPRLCEIVRAELADESIGALGATGANCVRGLAWWEGELVSASALHRYNEHGGGELRTFPWAAPTVPPREVQALDERLLVLSRWAVRNVRFDERPVLGHAAHLDYCLTVRAAGRRLVVADLPVVHHRSLELVSSVEAWTEAHIALAQKWGPALDGRKDVDWKQRAREEEARREAARAYAYTTQLRLDARVLEGERALRAVTGSTSWRLTEPLRWLNARRRMLLARNGNSALERPPDLVLGDDRLPGRDPGPRPQTREPLRD